MVDWDEIHNRSEFRRQHKQTSIDELIRIALTPGNDDEEDSSSWDAIEELHHRESPEVFEAARKLCESSNSAERVVGVNILAQLGLPVDTYLDETLEIFFRLFDTEQDVHVLRAIGSGLGHISDEPRKVKPLLKHKSHPDPEVRLGVVFGLKAEEDPLAIQALIELSSDEDDLVRDWATFGLGTQVDVDTLQIREALFRRASDIHDDSYAPGEALKGLANRHDERAFELILKHLQEMTNDDGLLILEAAETLGDPRFHSVLVKLRDVYEDGSVQRGCLERTITVCVSK